MSGLDEIDLAQGAASGAGPSTAPAGKAAGGDIDEDILGGAGAGEGDDDDAELDAMRARVAEMEAEAAKLRDMQDQAERERAGSGAAAPAGPTDQEKEEVDGRSVYVGNVDYGATPEEIQQHFQSCGNINRVTILCDKFTGHPKGFAYVEFADASLVGNAMVLNESLFRGRLIKVTAKRTNLPFMSRGRGRGRGRPYGRGRARGRGRGRGYY